MKKIKIAEIKKRLVNTNTEKVAEIIEKALKTEKLQPGEALAFTKEELGIQPQIKTLGAIV